MVTGNGCAHGQFLPAATLVKRALRENISEGHELVNSNIRMYFSAKDYRIHFQGIYIKSNETGFYPGTTIYPNVSLDFN